MTTPTTPSIYAKAHASHTVFRGGKAIGTFQTTWNNVHPPKFGKGAEGTDGWCEPLPSGLEEGEDRDGDFIVCEYSVTASQTNWVNAKDLAGPQTVVKNFWYRWGGAYHEVTKHLAGVVARLRTVDGVTPDSGGGFYARTPDGNGGYIDSISFPDRSTLVGKLMLNPKVAPVQIVHPSGGVEEWTPPVALQRSGFQISSVMEIEEI